jgi:hypothetical protein
MNSRSLYTNIELFPNRLNTKKEPSSTGSADTPLQKEFVQSFFLIKEITTQD